MMSKTAVIYWSGTGNTEAMAKAVAEGAGARLFTVSEISAGEAAGYDRLALGCPAMGAEVLEEGDIINVDVSTIYKGYYSDASRMFIIGKTDPLKEKLVRVTKECLEIGMQAAKPYSFVGDIGHAIERHAKKNGFSVVRDLCGHGVGLKFHEEPDVFHFGRQGTGMLLVPGMVFTIEPMINMGTWKVFVDSEDGWTVVTDDEKPSAQWEHTFVMTEKGVQILTH